MKSLADLLKNHPVPGIRLSEARRTCAAAASVFAKHPIDAKNVRLKGGVLFLSVPSVLKTELILRAQDLKKALAAAGVECTEIR
jgi:hypothetical protein